MDNLLIKRISQLAKVLYSLDPMHAIMGILLWHSIILEAFILWFIYLHVLPYVCLVYLLAVACTYSSIINLNDPEK